MEDLHYLKDFGCTSNIESFPWLYNKYYPKRLYFSFYGTVAKTQLAILNYNARIGLQQVETKDEIKDALSKCFLKCLEAGLLKKVYNRNAYLICRFSFDLKTSKSSEYCLPLISSISQHISSLEKSDKNEAIHAMCTKCECA